MNKFLLAFALALLSFTATPVRAQAPSIDLGLLDALDSLPLPEIAAAKDRMVKGLQRVTPNGWTSPKVGPLQMHAFLSGGAQAIVISYTGALALPDDLIDENLHELMLGTLLRDPLFVVSLVNGVLTTSELDGSLQQIVRQSYFNLPGLDIRSGMQIITRATVRGLYAQTFSLMGISSNDFILTLGKKKGLMGAPTMITGESNTDSTGTEGGDAARDFAKAKMFRERMKQKKAAKDAAKAAGKDLPKDPPDYFIEFQTAPGTVIKGPLGMSPITLTDTTLFASSLGTLGYKGNFSFASVPNKKFLAFYEAPYDAKGALKWTDFKFGLAAPSLNLAEFALIAASFTAPNAPSGGFLPNLSNMRAPINAMTRPLSMFRISNPNPVPEYRFGDPKYPFPSLEAFNLMLLGPFAKEILGGKEVPGPLLKAVGNTTVLGHTVGSMNVYFSEHGLKGDVTGDLGGLDLSAIAMGKPGLRARALVDISADRQQVSLGGRVSLPVEARDVVFAFNAAKIAMDSAASCALPVDLKGDLPYPSGELSLDTLARSISRANVDPGKITGCVGEALKAAYRWLGDNGGKFAGYTADAAKAAYAGLEKGAGVVVGTVAGTAVQAGEVLASTGRNFARGEWKHHPDRPVYDCENWDPNTNPKLFEAYPPGRIWGSQAEFNQRGMNFRRFVFSEADRKFHPITGADAKRTLGGTACGGLVGEEGVGYGRLNTADDEIWTKAVFCKAIPEAMIGAPVEGASQCYAARGLAKPRPDLAGKFVNMRGDSTNVQSFVAPDGTARFAGGGSNWAVYNGCGLSAQQYPATTLAADEIYRIAQGPAFRDANDCRNVMGAYWKPHRFAGQVLAYDCGNVKNTYIITREGQKRWTGNKDNWTVYNACAAPPVACVAATELSTLPDGPPIASAQDCVQTITAGGGNDAGWRARICAPSTAFDLAWYFQAYPDVANAAIGVADSKTALATTKFTGSMLNALRAAVRTSAKWKADRDQAGRDHWTAAGRNEGRQPNPYFNAGAYLARYADLRNGYGATNFAGAYEHWANAGCREGRNGGA